MNEYKAAYEALRNADHILIGASNGLSISEGYHIFADNDDFKKYFGEFRSKYGIDCLIKGVFYPFTDKAEHDSYMRIVRQYMIENYTGSEVMKNLLKIISGKDYFIITSNADTHFQINGFDKDKLFEIEGNFAGMAEQSDEWQKQFERYKTFLNKANGTRFVFLEIRIGMHNRLIKAPMMQIAQNEPNSLYIILNMPKELYLIPELRNKSIYISGDIADSFKEMPALI